MDIFNLKMLLVGFLVFVPLEYLFSLRTKQTTFRPGFANDVSFALVNAVLVKLGLIATVFAAMLLFDRIVPTSLREAVASQPVWLQVIEIIVIADIGFYFAHRAFHHWPLLWRFHAIHHSSEQLDWAATFKVHPVDQALTKSASFIPVFALGYSPDAIVIFGAIFYFHGLLLHSNTRIDLGPLRWVIASPQFHHWHHAEEKAAHDMNFAGQLPVIDALFGTLLLPGKDMPKSYGIEEETPRWLVPQLLYPFVRRANAITSAESEGAPVANEELARLER